VEAKDHQREVMMEDKVAATEDLQELHLFTFTFTFIQHLPHLIPSLAHRRLLTQEDILVVAVNLVVMEDQPDTLLHRVRNLINNQPQFPNPITNRFLLMEGNKEDHQEDTLLPLRTSQLQLLLMVLLLSLLEVIRTSNFSSRKIKINP
jgi:hypothetical protein